MTSEKFNQVVICQSKSKLLPFNLFVDEKGILRIGGRLKNANLSFQQKHQIIISSETHFAKLIIGDAHIRSEHGGTQIALSTIRNKFWIVNMPSILQSVERTNN